MTIGRIAEMCGGELNGAAEAVCHGVVIDSRQVYENCLFIPIIGERVDGHDFVADVLSKGASAALWQRDRGEAPAGNIIIVDNTLVALQQLAKVYLQQCHPQVVGITGSNGKTTTKDMVAALLGQAYRVHRTAGNFNSHIGLPLTILSMPADTEMLILEMGMRARGEIEFLSQLAEPDTVVITNIGESHLEQLGSREEIARAKLEITAGLKRNGLFIYPGDEPLLQQILIEPEFLNLSDVTFQTFGLEQSNDLHPIGIMNQGQHTIFTTPRYPDIVWTLPLPGLHNVSNAMAAMLVAEHYGVTPSQIQNGFSGLRLTGMRIEMTLGLDGTMLLNDAYNASPSSMKAAIDVLDQMKGYSRKLAVLGDMLELGQDEEHYHQQIGDYIAGKVDWLFTYGQRSLAMAKAASMRMSQERIRSYQSKQELIDDLLEVKASGDVILFKGSRGMRLEEVLQALMPDSISNAEALEE